ICALCHDLGPDVSSEGAVPLLGFADDSSMQSKLDDELQLCPFGSLAETFWNDTGETLEKDVEPNLASQLSEEPVTQLLFTPARSRITTRLNETRIREPCSRDATRFSPFLHARARKVWLSKVGSPGSRIDRAVFSNERDISKLEYKGFNTRY
ncbi:ACYP2 protein, partial [Atractosteus spatula]|nr:ACYP2 protein [Atractosteus spatula]